MSAELLEMEIEKFVAKHVSCATCQFWQNTLFPGEGICDGPELPLGHMSDDTSMCEQHEFSDGRLQTRLENLQDKFLTVLGY